MYALAELIKANGAELAELESLDNGKPLAGREGRHRGDRQPPALLRRLADQDRGRDDPGLGPRRPLLHGPRAGRGLRPDRPVELPAADGDLEGRPGARGGLPDRPQARRADAAHRAAARRARAGGGLPRRGPSTCSPATARTGAALVDEPGRRQGRLHRLDRGRARDRRQVRALAQARHPRARRQEPQHHPPRRRPRPGDQGLLRGHLLQLRPGLQRRLAPVRPARSLRRGHRAPRRLRPRGEGRPRPRPRDRSSARWSPRSSSSA